MGYWRKPEHPVAVAAAAIVALALMLAGCAGPGDGRLRIIGIEKTVFAAPELVLGIDLPQRLVEGLERGVPLRFRMDLRHDGRRDTYWRELRFAPLSRQYQIREPATGYSRGYDSRSAVLAALERWPLPDRAIEVPVQARVRLDTSRLPAPLVLPALFDGDWRLDSGPWRATPP